MANFFCPESDAAPVLRHLAVHLAVLAVASGQQLQVQLQVPRTRDLSAMVQQIAERFFPPGGLVLVSESQWSGVTAMRGVLQSGRWPVMTAENVVVDNPLCAPSSVGRWVKDRRVSSILVVGDQRSSGDVMRVVRFQLSIIWNSSALILVVLDGRMGVDEEDVLRLHALRITNLVLAEVEADGPVHLYSNFPPRRQVCQRDLRGFTRLDTYFPDTNSFALGQADLFLAREDGDCRRCPIVGSLSTLPSLYGYNDNVIRKVVDTVVAHMGCSMTILNHNESDFVRDNHWHGSFRHILHAQADVVLRALWITLNRSVMFDPSDYIQMERLNIFVTESKHLDLSHHFELEGVILVAMVLTVAVDCCLHNARSLVMARVPARRDSLLPEHGPGAPRRRPPVGARERTRRSQETGARPCCSVTWIAAMVTMWSLFLDQSPPRRRRASWTRFLWTSVALVAVALNSARKSLYAMDALRPRHGRLHSPDEVASLRVPLGIHDLTLYRQLIAPAYRGPWSQIVDCTEDTVACLHRLVREDSRFAFVVNAPIIVQVLPEEDTSRIWPLDTVFMTTPVVVYFAKGSAVGHRFNTLLRRLHNGGILSHLSRNGNDLKFWADRLTRTLKPQPLSLRDLGPLLSGMCLAVLPLPLAFFLGEVIVGLVWRRRKESP